MSANLYLDNGVEELIKLDVVRTFTHDKEFPRATLTNLLRAGTSVLRDTAGYCQGMNYLAGALLYLTQDEQKSFDLYVSLVRGKMADVFSKNFEKLKMFFYVVDKLIQFYLPDLGAEFKEKKIQSVFFCSSWFITLFTSAFQYTTKSYLVLYIVDLFVVDGFKAIFKTIIVLLKFYKSKIVGKSFEEIVSFLNDILRQEIFKNSDFDAFLKAKNSGFKVAELQAKFKHADDYEFVYNFKDAYNQTNISNKLIAKLESRFYSVGLKLKKL